MRNILFIAIVALLLPVSLAGQDSESRYDKEFVFVQGMRSISFGISPVILDGFMIRNYADSRTSVTLPPIHLMYERCLWDMGNGGSIGWGFFISHGRYTYTYVVENGYGSNEIVRAGMTDALVGLSYHYTIRTRLEAYARLMGGMGIEGYNSDKIGATHDMDAEIIWNGVVGMRYFFSNSFGVYVEGGYTSGCVNAGVTYRW